MASSLLISKCCREKPVLTTCWNCFFDLLLIAFIITVIHNGLPQRTLPLCLTVKLKCLWLAHREIIWLCPVKRREWHILSLKLIIPGDLLQAWSSSHFPTASPSLFCLLTLVPQCFFLALWKNLTSRPWQGGYFETLVCHPLGQPAFRIKLYSLPQHLISQIHWPIVWQAEGAWTL